MALKNIPTKEMVSLTRTMVDPGHEDHQLLMSRPMLAVCMPELQLAHGDVLRVHSMAQYARTLKEIIAEQMVVDDRHDNKVRGIWHRLMAEEYLAATPELADMFRRLREWLLPDGLATVNLSYRTEIGHADMVREQIAPEQEDLLQRLATHGGDMLIEAWAWLSLADELGQLEHRRAGIEVRGEGRGMNFEARNRWIRIIDHMRRAARFEGDDPELDELFRRIDRVQRLAEIRAQKRERTSADAEPDTDPAAVVEADEAEVDEAEADEAEAALATEATAETDGPEGADKAAPLEDPVTHDRPHGVRPVRRTPAESSLAAFQAGSRTHEAAPAPKAPKRSAGERTRPHSGRTAILQRANLNEASLVRFDQSVNAPSAGRPSLPEHHESVSAPSTRPRGGEGRWKEGLAVFLERTD